jgi:hypothetical protein
VCQACHRTSAVPGRVPGDRGAEGKEQGQGARREGGLEDAPSTRAGRRTGTGYEVWHTRDERARDGTVLHPQGVCLINPASPRGPIGVLPGESCRWSRAEGRRAEGAVLTNRQKSAEGGVDPTPATLGRHPKADRWGNR